MSTRYLRIVRAIALVSGVGATACSSRDTGPSGRLAQDYVPDENAAISTDDAWVNPYLDSSVTDARGDVDAAQSAADSSIDTDYALDDTGDDDTGPWMLPETCPVPNDASDEASIDDATLVDANTDAPADTADTGPPPVDRTCRCEFEEVWQYPCIPPCIDYLEAEANGCVAGPLPPPDLPNV